MKHHWKPSVTVAAVIEHAGRFLLVEEQTSEGLRLNQPAGHLEPHESLPQACTRETLEETAHEFTPTYLIGVYLWRFISPGSGAEHTYLRFAFAGNLGQKQARELDHGIVGTLWMTRDELAACPERHRSPLLMQCIDDYLAGQRSELDMLHTHASVSAEPPFSDIANPSQASQI